MVVGPSAGLLLRQPAGCRHRETSSKSIGTFSLTLKTIPVKWLTASSPPGKRPQDREARVHTSSSFARLCPGTRPARGRAIIGAVSSTDRRSKRQARQIGSSGSARPSRQRQEMARGNAGKETPEPPSSRHPCSRAASGLVRAFSRLSADRRLDSKAEPERRGWAQPAVRSDASHQARHRQPPPAPRCVRTDAAPAAKVLWQGLGWDRSHPGFARPAM
jgi:hypothetical protein